MADQQKRAVGMQRIIEKCRQVFRQSENLNHYSEEDLKNAERKYIKYCLLGKAY